MDRAYLHKQIDELEEWTSVPNWDSYGSEPLPKIRYQNLRELVNRLPFILSDHIWVGIDGVHARYGPYDFYIDVDESADDSTRAYSTYHGIEAPRESLLDDENADGTAYLNQDACDWHEAVQVIDWFNDKVKYFQMCIDHAVNDMTKWPDVTKVVPVFTGHVGRSITFFVFRTGEKDEYGMVHSNFIPHNFRATYAWRDYDSYIFYVNSQIVFMDEVPLDKPDEDGVH